MDFGDAGIFDFKDRHFPERQIQEDRKEHANDTAVANHGDGFAGGFRENLVEGDFYAFPEFRDGFSAFDRAVFELMEPGIGADAVFLEDFIPAQASPCAEIDFAQAFHQDRFEAGLFSQGGEGLLDAAHRARIHRVRRRGPKKPREGADLFVAQWGKFHIDAAAEDFVISLFDLTVTDEVESRQKVHFTRRRLFGA